MSESEAREKRAASSVETVEEIAVSVDKHTVKAVEAEFEGSDTSHEIVESAMSDALEAAAMVAEGGPVAEPVNGVAPVEHDAEPDEAGAVETMEAEGGPTDGQPGADTTETAAIDSELAAEYGPVPMPPMPGPGNPSPDDSTLAFLQADISGETRLWLYALDGSGGWSMSLPFVPVIDEYGPQWSPDGKWLAMPGSRSQGSTTAIWLAPVDGGDCILLADHDAADRQPRWSPDGSLVAFVSNRDGRDAICVALPDGMGPVIQLTSGFPGQDDRDPCWSEDSTRIAFIRRAIDGENAGDHVWTVSLASGELKQATKKLANRHSLRWCPSKAQLAFISDEGEWLNVAVVNPDNSAGWNLASEAGDKDDPRYSPDGGRLLYTRATRGEVRLCERPTSGASPDLIDPGMGVASAPRWLSDKRVVYRFAPCTGGPYFVVQDAKKDAERTILPAAVPWQAGRPLIAPAHVEFETTSGLKLGGLLYRDPSLTGRIPGIVYLGDDPHQRCDASFRPFEQALAAAGFAVFTPTLPGTPGLGKKIANALRETLSADQEALDLADAVEALRAMGGIDDRHIAVVGTGYGAAQAMLLAGIRPGVVEAVVAIDPVADWDDEFDTAGAATRAWHVRQFGLPAASRARHSLRSPATFAAVIESPLLVIGSDSASRGRKMQLDSLIATMTDLGVTFDQQSAGAESAWELAERAAAFIRGHFGPNQAPVEEPAVAGSVASETERADDI